MIALSSEPTSTCPDFLCDRAYMLQSSCDARREIIYKKKSLLILTVSRLSLARRPYRHMLNRVALPSRMRIDSQRNWRPSTGPKGMDVCYRLQKSLLLSGEESGTVKGSSNLLRSEFAGRILYAKRAPCEVTPTQMLRYLGNTTDRTRGDGTYVYIAYLLPRG